MARKVNKVVLGSETLLDLTSDTATANRVLKGYTFHLKDGDKTTGTLDLSNANVVNQWSAYTGTTWNALKTGKTWGVLRNRNI